MNIQELYDLYKDQNPKTMGSGIKDEILSSLSALNKVEDYEEAKKFIEILALCRKAQAAMDGDAKINTIRTLLSAGEEGAYVENNSYINERFMYELIQNVDDCKYHDPKDCKLIIDFDIQHDKMVLDYNELGFRPKDVIAISDIGNSTKNHHKSFDQKKNSLNHSDLQEIGEKGIGFKSIFGLADKVCIESGYFQFYFDYDNFTIPKNIKYLSGKKREGTKLTIFLKKGITAQLYKMLEEKYKEKKAIINENPVLFLNKLTEIIYRTNRGYFGFRASRDTEKPFINGERMTIEYLSSKIKHRQSIQCYRYAKEITYSLAECRARFGNDEEQPRTYKLEIILPADAENWFSGRIYSFFPTEQELSVPMIIQAPFKLDSSRTNIANQSVTADSSNLWFVRTKTETIQFLYHVLKDMAHKIGFRIIDFIPKNNLVTNFRCPLYDSSLFRDRILQLDLFESIDGKYFPATKLCYLDKPNLSLDEAKEIYELLNIKIPMVNTKPDHRLAKYGFIPIEDIDNKLFQAALVNPRSTSQCLKYLHEYSPESFEGDDIYILEINQIKNISSFPSIVEFINSQLIRRLRNEKAITFYLDDKQCPEIPSDLVRVKEYCKENKEELSQPLYDFVKEVMFVKDNFWEKPIYMGNCLFGGNIVKVFDTLFNKISRKYKNFFSLIQIEENDKEIDRLIHDEESSRVEFFRNLVKIRQLQKNILGRQYESIINLIGEMGTKPQRFLMELLQNIDDCNFDEDPYAEFYLVNNKLTVFYNETGFTRENIASITAFGDSTKQYLKHENVTGEKGIGFKSIFTVASNVEIHSNEFHFSLSSSEPTVPIEIRFNKFVHGTKMIIDVKNGFIDNYFNEDYLCSICLCLKKVKRLVFNGKELLVQDQKNKRIVTFGNKHEYYRFVYHYKIDNDSIRKARFKNSLVNEEQTITYLVPKKKQECVLYSTFPTLEPMEVPIIVNADLKLITSRERILESDAWNEDVIKKIQEGFLWMLDQLKTVDYKKIADILPYDGYLMKNFRSTHIPRYKIKALPIFKVFNTSNKFISLNDGFIAEDLDKYIIKKWGYGNEPYRSNCIDFDLSKITSEYFYEGVDFVDSCTDLADPDSYDKIHPEFLQDDEFRKRLYKYISSYDKRKYLSHEVLEEIGMENWEIIPVLQDGKTQYVKYSDNIFYIEDHVENISKKVLILDQEKMDVQLFDFIYCNLHDRYNYIEAYSDRIILDEIVDKINQYVNLKKEENATQILKLFLADKRLFEECIEQRNDINLDSICLMTRDGRYLLKKECYLPIGNECDSILDHVTVADPYLELAEALEVDKVSHIKEIINIFDYFTYDDLNRMCDLKFLNQNINFFDTLYLSMFEYGYNILIEHEVYMKLMGRISSKAAKCDQDSFRDVTSLINSDCLSKYGNTITKIFFEYPNHSLAFGQDIKLIAFDQDDVLNDMRNDILTRKMDDRCQMVRMLLENCYYAENLKESIVPIRLKGNINQLLVNKNITSEHDIIETFKEFFQSKFSLHLNVTRDAERYTRDGYKQISTIDYNLDDEMKMTRMAEHVDFDNVSQIKDFMCRPLRVNNKVVGGYARTCPICGAKVQTELTGMRLYKFKDNHNIYQFICCPNCYENFRYSAEFTVNTEDYQNNYLTFKGYVNGEEWRGDHIKIRLGHKAILNVLNKKKN